MSICNMSEINLDFNTQRETFFFLCQSMKGCTLWVEMGMKVAKGRLQRKGDGAGRGGNRATKFSNKPDSAETTFYKHAAKLAPFVKGFVKH